MIPFAPARLLYGLRVAALPPLAVAIALLSFASAAHAQPHISESDPQDGDILQEPPQVIGICFSEPVEIEETGAFTFGVLTPERQRLGMRIVFQIDGECVDIEPGRAPGEVEGLWTIEWQVTSRADGQPGSGSFQFHVSKEGNIPAPTPTPDETVAPLDEADDNGADTLPLILIVIGAVAGAAILTLVLYRLRGALRRGRPPTSKRG